MYKDIIDTDEKDFIKVCFNIVAGLEVKNESQAIAKEAILDEVEYLQQRIDKAIEYIEKEWYWDGTGIDYVLEILEGKSE